MNQDTALVYGVFGIWDTAFACVRRPELLDIMMMGT